MNRPDPAPGGASLNRCPHHPFAAFPAALALAALALPCLWLAPAPLALSLSAADQAESAVDRPNFLFIITDDISRDDLGCYGHPLVRTPHLDQLAAEGRLFENAYVVSSSCSVSRCSIITGRYPHNHGAPELHTQLPPGHFLFTQALKDAGYYTALSGKHHMGPAVNDSFDHIDGGSDPGMMGNWLELLQNRPEDQPFFFWFAAFDAHRPWRPSNHAVRYNPDDIEVPPYLVDSMATREDLAEYYHAVSRTDHFVGLLREELERQGIADNTWIIYTADNGRPFPRDKTRVFDSGMAVPLIITRPGHTEPGRSASLASSIDLAPTILELAGLDGSERIQGVSLAPVIADPAAVVRDVIYSVHNWHVFQAHVRMVRHGDHVYARNAFPERRLWSIEASLRYPSGAELATARDAGTLTEAQQEVFLQPRPAEELYHLPGDPLQLDNLAANPEHAPVLDHLRALLDRWVEQTGDSVPDNPTADRDDHDGNRLPDWERGEFPGAATNAVEIDHPGPIFADQQPRDQ